MMETSLGLLGPCARANQRALRGNDVGGTMPRSSPRTRVLAAIGATCVAVRCASTLMAQTAGASSAAEADSSSRASACRRDDEASLAFCYAPVLRFAPGERDYPIYPFFSTFILQGDPAKRVVTPDLAGTLLVLPDTHAARNELSLQPAIIIPDTMLSWNSLNDHYDAMRAALTPEQVGIAVRLRSSLRARVDTLARWRTLLAEPGALGRSSADSLLAALGRPFGGLGRIQEEAVRQALAESLAVVSAGPALVAEILDNALHNEDWVPSVATVFFRISRFDRSESKRTWQKLQSDFQLWSRLDLPESMAGQQPESLPRLMSAEYYIYYLKDAGLTGHAQDMEKVFVLFPERRGEQGHRIQIQIGAAHSIVTPNNVLVLTNAASGVEEERRPQILVEYGGHSNAPDRLPYGSFVSGWDINWRASERSWGVRDVQAALGTGYSGDYRNDYTFPRIEDSGGITLYPIPVDSNLQALRTSCEAQAPPTQEVRSNPACRGHYSLMRIRPLHRVFNALQVASLDSLHVAWDGLTADVGKAIGPVREWPKDSNDEQALLARMRLWLKKPAVIESPRDPWETEDTIRGEKTWLDMMPWKESEYIQSPDNALKAWLYRPQTQTSCHQLWDFIQPHPRDLKYFELGFRYRNTSRAVHGSMMVDVIDTYHCIERTLKLGIPGTLSVGASLSPWDRTKPMAPREIQLRYQQRYFSPQSLSWSVGLSYVTHYEAGDRSDELAVPSRKRSRWRVRPAVDIMPLGMALGAGLSPTRWHLVLSSVTVRIGPQIDLYHPLRSLPWQVELAVRPVPVFFPGGKRGSTYSE